MARKSDDAGGGEESGGDFKGGLVRKKRVSGEGWGNVGAGGIGGEEGARGGGEWGGCFAFGVWGGGRRGGATAMTIERRERGGEEKRKVEGGS